jgi:hypothetical protein
VSLKETSHSICLLKKRELDPFQTEVMEFCIENQNVYGLFKKLSVLACCFEMAR